MRFKTYWRELPAPDKANFAEGCGTSPQNIERKYANADQVPRRPRLEKMIELATPAVSRDEMLEHFYPVKEQGAA